MQDKFDLNKYDLPTIMNFNLTWRCNLRCKMCNNWALDEGNDKRELSTKEIISTVKRYKNYFDIKRVRFWGGEPFLREDLPEIINAISHLAHIEVITNGTLINQSIANKIIDSGLHLIEFSVDYPEEHHNYLRGNGVYQKALEAVDILKDEKNRQKKRYPIIKLRPLITRSNYLHFKEMYLFAMRKDIGFRFVFLRDHYYALTNTFFEDRFIGYYQPGLGGKHNIEIGNLVLFPELCRKIWIQQYELEHNVLNGSIFKKTKHLLRTLDYFLSHAIYFDCSRSRRNVLIDPYGNLYPCEFLLYKYGHCFDDTQESWFSEKHREIRQKIIDGFFPICRECNRYGLYRPVFPISNSLSRWYHYLLHDN